jgi:hypothetical protein
MANGTVPLFIKAYSPIDVTFGKDSVVRYVQPEKADLSTVVALGKAAVVRAVQPEKPPTVVASGKEAMVKDVQPEKA